MEAFLYEKLDDKKIQCNLCSHRCIIKDKRRGICGVRENRSGKLETLVYGKLIARHIDPIEKKPVFHLAPGSRSYSIATVGCNFKCRFCQNSDIAQFPSEEKFFLPGEECRPEDVVNEASNNKCRTIAYTYTEPTVYFEFAFETARLAHKQKIKNIFVTNGFMTPEAINMIAPYLDAANVDLKAFTEEFYKKWCGASLEPVKNTLKLMKSLGIMVEVTTLLIPGLNDNPQEIENLASFIANSLGRETPWHISRFHPAHRLNDRPPTPLKTIMMARDSGINAGLKYVYTGNVPGQESESTYCWNCGDIVIERYGFYIRKNSLKNSRCPSCDAVIHGVDL